MRLKKYYVLLLISFPLILISCYSDYGLATKDFDVVITFRDNEVNFRQYRTYAMPDSVVRMIDSTNTSQPNTTFDQTILDEVEKQMTAAGYTRVEPDTNDLPDVIVLAGVTSSDYYAAGGGYWWGWWGWYPGWGYYPGYGSGWYPSYGYIYSYTTGTLLISMIDPAKTDANNKTIGVVWSGALNGIITDSESDTRVRIIDGIDQIFRQSSYLKVYR
jgi:hypothetical protein